MTFTKTLSNGYTITIIAPDEPPPGDAGAYKPNIQWTPEKPTGEKARKLMKEYLGFVLPAHQEIVNKWNKKILYCVAGDVYSIEPNKPIRVAPRVTGQN